MAFSLLVAYIVIKIQGYRETKKLKKAFIAELQTNLQILNKLEKDPNQDIGYLDRYLPRLHSTVYKELIRSGLILTLPPHISNKITEVYEAIEEYNTTAHIANYIGSRAETIIEPNINTIKTKIQQLQQKLQQQWKIKTQQPTNP